MYVRGVVRGLRELMSDSRLNREVQAILAITFAYGWSGAGTFVGLYYFRYEVG